MARAAPPKKYFFLELTNRCNFSCTFCADGIMARPRQSMDKGLAFKVIDEIARDRLTTEPLQLHLMGEPFLYPQLFEVIDHIHSQGLSVRLFTNGALLNAKNRQRIYGTEIEELVIGIHTPTEPVYNDLRRGKPDFETYMRQIKDTVEDKFRRNSAMRIILQYLNTKHFNRSRLEQGYPEAALPLIDSEEKALLVIEEWKAFGRRVSGMCNLDHEPVDLEGLQGPYQAQPLDCLKGDHLEVLPGVILSFKDISTFSDYLLRDVRYVERYRAVCRSFDEQLAVLSSGDCTPCCVDYDGKIVLGNAKSWSLTSLLHSKNLRRLQNSARRGLLPTPTCRVCQAILVKDDYAKKFPGAERAPYALESGWYPLESDGTDSFRWTGKRAVLILQEEAAEITLRIRNGHPRRERLGVSLLQGKLRKSFPLQDRSWTTLSFRLKSSRKHGTHIVLEAEDFWIPAEDLEDNQDRRELGVMVANISLTPRYAKK